MTACARYKSRKQRCDQNIPACSNCERAGVECVGHDADGSVLPRRYSTVASLNWHALLTPKATSRVLKIMLQDLNKSWQPVALRMITIHQLRHRCLETTSSQHLLKHFPKPVWSPCIPQPFPAHVTWEVRLDYHYFVSFFSAWDPHG